MANIAVSVIDANNISLVLTARPPVSVTLDRGVSGVGIASISGTTISGSYYLVVTYTNGTTQNVGPFSLTGTVAAGANTQIQYNSSGALAGSANLTFNGTNLIAGADATINGVKVGRGAGSIATNTAVGASALAANTTGSENSAFGILALAANTTGTVNTAIGNETLLTATTATQNVAVGHRVGLAITTGGYNTGLGAIALRFNTTGQYNTALGNSALFSNTTASNNTAVGYQAGYSNTTSLDNIFIGFQAGYSTTTGTGRSIAIGMRALFSASTATDNTAIGYYVGNGITTGVANTAVGGGLYGITSSTLQSNSTGSYNSAFGISALASNTTASNNTAVGYQAGYSSTGQDNSFFGYGAGRNNTTGNYNTFIGRLTAYNGAVTGVENTATGISAFYNLTSGSYNAAYGANGMFSNTSGANNTAVGNQALYFNTTASNNTAVGYQTLYTNTGGNSTAVGYQALKANTTGGSDAFGYQALTANTTGAANNAFGLLALATNTTGSYNTAFGQQSLISNTTASNNTAVGYQAGLYATGGFNTIVGSATTGAATFSGTYNTLMGYGTGNSLVSGSNNTFIGTLGSSNYCGAAITTGSKNTIIGGYSGNQGGLDIRTANNYIVLSDGDGNVRQTIDGSGNVGIGVTPNAWEAAYKVLQLNSNGAGLYSGGYDANLTSNLYQNTNSTYKQIGASYKGALYKQFDSTHSWYTTTNVGANTAVVPTQAMTLDAAGRLGIAVTPSTWASNWKGIEFQVGGSVGSFSTGTMVIGGNTINNGSNNIYKTAAGASLYSQYNGSHAWYSAASGTAGSTISWSIGMQMNTSGVSVDKLFAVTHIAGTGSGIPYINFSYAGTTIGSITQSGTTAVLYNTTSDYRLKNNARALVGSGEFIDALKPTTWEWSEDGRTDSGFLAHEFQTVSPYSVNGEKDAEDEEGNAVYQSMQASSAQVIANLVAEIQDLRKRLAAAGI
jgi:hypothetical protein